MKARAIRGHALAGVIVCSLLWGCAEPEQPPRQLKFSVVGAIGSAWHLGASRFSDLVRDRTRGKLVVTVYPEAQLAGGDQLRELKMLAEGKIDFTYHSTLLYSNLDKKFFVLSMPWIMRHQKDVDKFFVSPAGRRLLDLTLDHGIFALAYGENGFRQITNSKREIQTPEDLKGLRVRVPNVPLYPSIYRALGAEPMIMNFGAVYKALQEDVVDAQENPISVALSARFYDVQKYITVWNYSYDALILGVNRKLYDSLDKTTQEVLLQSAAEASAYEIEVAREMNRTQRSLFEEKGMVITELTSTQVQMFRDMMEAIYAGYEPLIGKELMDEVRSIGGSRER